MTDELRGFKCTVCGYPVSDHYAPECKVCPPETSHVLCETHHDRLKLAGLIKGYEEVREGPHYVGTIQGTIETCPTKAVVLGIRMMR